MIARTSLVLRAVELRGYDMSRPHWYQFNMWPDYVKRICRCVVLVTVPLLIGTLRGTTTMAMVADARGFGASKKRGSLSLMAEKRLRRNLSRADHRQAYVAGYAPFEEIAPGLAELMYDEWKTSPLTMVPYPDTPAVLKAFSSAGLPIGIVSNTGWSIDRGYAATGLDAFIGTFVLSCDLGPACRRRHGRPPLARVARPGRRAHSPGG